jgi:hypothetical protein
MNCTTSAAGLVRCRDAEGAEQFKAIFKAVRSNPSTLRFKMIFLRQAIDGPLAGPVQIILGHNAAVVRTDSLATCKPSGRTLKCR